MEDGGGGMWGMFGSALSAALGSEAQSGVNQQNKEAAEAQMGFQASMSNSAHQREVSDLIAAGLNPILSATKGASSPGGAMYVAQSPYQAGVNAASGTAAAGLARSHSAKADAETETEHERKTLVRNEAIKVAVDAAFTAGPQTKLTEEQTKLVQEQAHAIGYVNAKVITETSFILKQIEATNVTMDKMRQEMKLLIQQEKFSSVHEGLMRVQTLLEREKLPEAKAFADMFRTKFGASIPYIREGLHTVEGVMSSAAKGAVGGAIRGWGKPSNSSPVPPNMRPDYPFKK